MLFLSGLVGALLLLTAEARVGNSSDCEFCTETEECLLYDLVCETDRYEVRHYSAVKWVYTTEKGYIMEFAVWRAVERLIEYISGENKEGKKIKMTTPVVVTIPENTRFWEKNEYVVSFLLPSEHQRNAPMPTDDKQVLFYDQPEMYMYVLGYGGWMTSLSDKIKSSSLSRALNSAGAKYVKDLHFAVVYNSPMKWFDRHNEVWMLADGKPVCSSSEDMDIGFPFFN
ncbi:heme-binding protein 2-like [Cheilinus undulatus]|uniref:heme-binding protein 2-like n=1 Tax=Cheilinus undulatus TaxID=241271 RepID=UPI001BD1EDDD|nr:heme-binding protein 2-like [Cheilinus undulatus]